jgi:tRNA pseudouridine65 synthase
MKHISHPIIGDAKHGKGVHNRYFKQHLDAGRLLLHAAQLTFTHPISEQAITLNAPVGDTLQQLLERFNWLDSLPAEWR